MNKAKIEEIFTGVLGFIVIAGLICLMAYLLSNITDHFAKSRLGQKVEYWLTEPNEVKVTQN